jgi:bacteriocin-like protein
MIEKLNNETVVEQSCMLTELTENELSHISGGILDDGTGQVGWCGTKPPGSHPPVVHHS